MQSVHLVICLIAIILDILVWKNYKLNNKIINWILATIMTLCNPVACLIAATILYITGKYTYDGGNATILGIVLSIAVLCVLAFIRFNIAKLFNKELNFFKFSKFYFFTLPFFPAFLAVLASDGIILLIQVFLLLFAIFALPYSIIKIIVIGGATKERLIKLYKYTIVVMTTFSNQIWFFIAVLALSLATTSYNETNGFIMLVYVALVMSVLSFTVFKIIRYFNKNTHAYDYSKYFISTIIFFPYIIASCITWQEQQNTISAMCFTVCVYLLLCILNFTIIKLYRKIFV